MRTSWDMIRNGDISIRTFELTVYARYYTLKIDAMVAVYICVDAQMPNGEVRTCRWLINTSLDSLYSDHIVWHANLPVEITAHSLRSLLSGDVQTRASAAGLIRCDKIWNATCDGVYRTVWDGIDDRTITGHGADEIYASTHVKLDGESGSRILLA